MVVVACVPRSGLFCKKCGSNEFAVLDSRPFEGGIRRRRKCENCGEKYTTYEMMEGSKSFWEMKRKAAEYDRLVAKIEGMKKLSGAIDAFLEEVGQ